MGTTGTCSDEQENTTLMNQTINDLLTSQLDTWEMARNNYAALSGVQVRELDVNGIPYKVQFNPARIVSSGAKVDAKSIKERKCFLCPANLPPVQKGIPFEGHYNILVNPFPIFPRHLTIPEVAHVDQRIAVRFNDMLALAQVLTDYIITAADFAELEGKKADKVIIEVSSMEDMERYKEFLSDDLYIQLSENKIGMIMKKNATKSNGIIFLAQS